MAFLDFIKNRQQQSTEQSTQPKPETAREMYARETAVQQATAKPLSQISPEQQSKVVEAQTLYSRGTREAGQTTPAPTSLPEDGATSPQPMRQNMISQDKATPNLSPTSAQSGARTQDVEGPSAPAATPAKSQQQTIARPTPSWER